MEVRKVTQLAQVRVTFIAIALCLASRAYGQSPAAPIIREQAKSAIAKVADKYIEGRTLWSLLRAGGRTVGLDVSAGGLAVALSATALAGDPFLGINGAFLKAQEERTPTVEEYIKRLSYFYLRDPEFLNSVPKIISQAVNMVNEACARKNLSCGLQPSQVFISQEPESKYIVKGDTCLFFVPADDFIQQENSARVVASHLAENMGWCQIPKAVDKIMFQYNSHGQVSHWYSFDDNLPFYKAAKIFAKDLIGVTPPETPELIQKSYTQYLHKVRLEESDKLRFRFILVPQIWKDDIVLAEPCGVTESTQFFYESLPSCQEIEVTAILSEKTLNSIGYLEGYTHVLGAPQDNVSRSKARAKFISALVGLGGGQLASGIFFDLLTKRGILGSLEMAAPGGWRAKSVRFVARAGIDLVFFVVGEQTAEWMFDNAIVKMTLPQNIDEEEKIFLEALTRESDLVKQGDQPNQDTLQFTRQEFEKTLGADSRIRVEILKNLVR